MTTAQIAAYNHGFCYCITYAQIKSINIEALDRQALDFYPNEKTRSFFKSGYLYALDEANSGKRGFSQF